MARIGFDGLTISQGKGIARVQRYALEALAARGDHTFVVFVREPFEMENVQVVTVGARPTLAWELFGLPRVARAHDLDLFVTFSERLPLWAPVPIVVWLFESPVRRIDMNKRARAPLWHRGSDLFTALLWRRSLGAAATRVATGSRSTERELLDAIPSLAGRTDVVYPALAPGFTPGTRRSDEPYALHLGSNDPRDNTAVAVEACRRAGIRLVVVGGWRGEGAESSGWVTDEELVDLYRGASVYIDPTLYEGFGYGVLEAMACGVPVVASDATSIPEVVGGAGLLSDPSDIDGFAASVSRVLEEPELASTLRARGLERAASFTWEKTGAALTAAIEAALP